MKQILNAPKHIRNYLMKWIAVFPCSRKLLNAVYRSMSPSQLRDIHGEFSKIFRNSAMQGRNGSWDVVFNHKDIRIPLSKQQFWLDWDTALSVVGQDIEVRQTYAALINSPDRPELFIDIGANYGTHSLLFLVHQVPTLSFEPNSSCHAYYRRLCTSNQVAPRIEPVALGEKSDWVTLSYPENDTWLGTTDIEVVEKFGLTQKLVTETVEQKRLDDYFAQIGTRRVLIKIDTEGHELAVLKGAERILREISPLIIFECWSNDRRTDLFNFFNTRNYQIYELPWMPKNKSSPINLQEFLESRSINYLALSIQ